MIRKEVWKAFHNPYFYFAIIVGVSISLADNIGVFRLVQELCELSGFNSRASIPTYHNISLWRLWFPYIPSTFGGYLFFYVWPLLAALPYGWSYLEEKKTGSFHQSVSRCGRNTYVISKIVACFISGGVAVALPLVQNLLVDAMFCPVTLPDPAFNYPIFNGLFASKLFYSHPWIYALLWCFMNFLFGGTTAVLCLVPGSLPRFRITVIMFPMVFYLLIEIIYNHFLAIVGHFSYSIAPLHLVWASPMDYNPAWLITIQLCILLSIGIYAGFWQVLKHEL